MKTGETTGRKDIMVAQMGHRGPEISPAEEKKIDLKNIGSKKPSVLPEKVPTPNHKANPEQQDNSN